MKSLTKLIFLGIFILFFPFILSSGSQSYAAELYELGEVLSKPYKFQSEIIRLKGVVKSGFGISVPTGRMGAYILQDYRDDSKKLVVLTNNELPKEDSFVEIEGRLEVMATIGSTSVGVFFIEIKRLNVAPLPI